jgi:hypothetical protein
MNKARSLFGATLAFLVLACGTTTTIPLVWNDPAYTGGALDRILVIGIGENDGRRRVFEDYFAELLTKRGNQATASYTVLPATGRLSEGAIREVLDGGQYDGALLTRLIGEDLQTEYVAPRTYTVPRGYYGGYYGYYNRSWDVVHEPGYYKTNTIVRLETNLYDVEIKALIWTGQSETMNPRDDADTIRSATHAVAKRLAKDGVIQ